MTFQTQRIVIKTKQMYSVADLKSPLKTFSGLHCSELTLVITDGFLFLVLGWFVEDYSFMAASASYDIHKRRIISRTRSKYAARAQFGRPNTDSESLLRRLRFIHQGIPSLLITPFHLMT